MGYFKQYLRDKDIPEEPPETEECRKTRIEAQYMNKIFDVFDSKPSKYSEEEKAKLRNAINDYKMANKHNNGPGEFKEIWESTEFIDVLNKIRMTPDSADETADCDQPGDNNDKTEQEENESGVSTDDDADAIDNCDSELQQDITRPLRRSLRLLNKNKRRNKF